MPTRSWLAKAKNVQDIDPCYYKEPWDAKKEETAKKKRALYKSRPIPVDPLFAPFFNSNMHDSWLLGIERTKQTLTVSLNSINGNIFADGLATVLNMPLVERAWRVDLQLHDPAFVRAARYDQAGALRFEDWSRLTNVALTSPNQFLSDRFFQQDGRLQWIAELWCWRKEDKRCSDTVLLMVDCTRATAVDHRARAIEAAFGSAALPIWQDALNGVGCLDTSKPYEPWGHPTMEHYIERRMAAHGIKITDLKTNGDGP